MFQYMHLHQEAETIVSNKDVLTTSEEDSVWVFIFYFLTLLSTFGLVLYDKDIMLFYPVYLQ